MCSNVDWANLETGFGLLYTGSSTCNVTSSFLSSPFMEPACHSAALWFQFAAATAAIAGCGVLLSVLLSHGTASAAVAWMTSDDYLI